MDIKHSMHRGDVSMVTLKQGPKSMPSQRLVMTQYFDEDMTSVNKGTSDCIVDE